MKTFVVLRKDNDTLPDGFYLKHSGATFRWDDDMPSHEDDAARCEARLELAIAALESVGYSLTFIESEDDAAEHEVEGVDQFDSLDGR